MKRRTKVILKDKLVNITVDLLEFLYFAGGDTFSAMLSKKQAFKIFNDNFYHKHTETPFTKWLNNLRDQGYIAYKPGSTSFQFTNKTKIKLAKPIGEKIKETEIYYFFSFDVPEKKRDSRNGFRKTIKNLGCKQIQKSLWAINKDVYDFVQMAAREFGVEQYIISIVSSKTDIDGILDRLFYLK